MEDFKKGIISTIAAFLWWFTLGYLGVWGNIVPYVTSYCRLYDDSIALEDANLVFPTQIFISGILMYPATTLGIRIGVRITLCIAGSFMVLGVFIASFVTNFWVFFAVYGILFSLGNAMSLTTVMTVPWSYLPNHKGKITGVVGSGIVIGKSLWTLLTGLQANPDNLRPDIVEEVGEVTNYYFSEEVALGVPKMLRIDALLLLVLVVVVILLIRPRKQDSEDEQDAKLNMIQVLKDKNFYTIMLAAFFVYPGVIYTAATYKIYGSTMGIDDIFLSLVGTVANIAAGIARILSALIFDCIGFKRTGIIIYSVASVLFLTLPFIAEYKFLYMLWMILIFMTKGSSQPVFGSVCATTYGAKMGAKVFALIVSMMGLSGMLIGFLQKILIRKIGYTNMWMVIMSCTLISVIIILLFYRQQKSIVDEKKSEKENQADQLKEPLLKMD